MFLQTNVAAWQRVLATEISANFRDATIREVIDSIARQSRANIVVLLDPPSRKPTAQVPRAHLQRVPLPPITQKFRRVPLRTVLYQIGQRAGLTIDWLDEQGFPHAIVIRSR